MGLLTEGKPLSWADTKKHAEHVHRVGVQQFLAIYKRLKDRKGDTLKWGDEARVASLPGFAICVHPIKILVAFILRSTLFFFVFPD